MQQLGLQLLCEKAHNRLSPYLWWLVGGALRRLHANTMEARLKWWVRRVFTPDWLAQVCRNTITIMAFTRSTRGPRGPELSCLTYRELSSLLRRMLAVVFRARSILILGTTQMQRQKQLKYSVKLTMNSEAGSQSIS